MTNCYGLDFNRALNIDYVHFIDEWILQFILLEQPTM